MNSSSAADLYSLPPLPPLLPVRGRALKVVGRAASQSVTSSSSAPPPMVRVERGGQSSSATGYQAQNRVYLQKLQDRIQLSRQQREATNPQHSDLGKREQGFSVCFSGANAPLSRKVVAPPSATQLPRSRLSTDRPPAEAHGGRASAGGSVGRRWDERTVEIRGSDGEVYAVRPTGERVAGGSGAAETFSYDSPVGCLNTALEDATTDYAGEFSGVDGTGMGCTGLPLAQKQLDPAACDSDPTPFNSDPGLPREAQAVGETVLEAPAIRSREERSEPEELPPNVLSSVDATITSNSCISPASGAQPYAPTPILAQALRLDGMLGGAASCGTDVDDSKEPGVPCEPAPVEPHVVTAFEDPSPTEAVVNAAVTGAYPHAPGVPDLSSADQTLVTEAPGPMTTAAPHSVLGLGESLPTADALASRLARLPTDAQAVVHRLLLELEAKTASAPEQVGAEALETP